MASLAITAGLHRLLFGITVATAINYLEVEFLIALHVVP